MSKIISSSEHRSKTIRWPWGKVMGLWTTWDGICDGYLCPCRADTLKASVAESSSAKLEKWIREEKTFRLRLMQYLVEKKNGLLCKSEFLDSQTQVQVFTLSWQEKPQFSERIGWYLETSSWGRMNQSHCVCRFPIAITIVGACVSATGTQEQTTSAAFGCFCLLFSFLDITARKPCTSRGNKNRIPSLGTPSEDGQGVYCN